MRCRLAGGTLRLLPRLPTWPLHRKDTKLTKVRFAKALGTLLLLFTAAYGPAFLTVALLKVRPFEAVPVIIVISLVVAMILIKVGSGNAGASRNLGFDPVTIATLLPRLCSAYPLLGRSQSLSIT